MAMEIKNIKDFSTNLKVNNDKGNSGTIYTYKDIIDLIREELAQLRKMEIEKSISITNSLGDKDKVVIKDKEYLRNQKIIAERDIRTIIQRKQYKVREYLNDTDALVKKLVDEFVGFSVLTPAFEDPEVSDIFCQGYNNIFVEKKGVNMLYPYSFDDEKHYNNFIERLAKESGKELNKGDSKILDFDLYEDRYCATDDGVSPNGKSLTIRKHGADHITLEQIIQFGCMNQEVADFLGMIIAGESNVIYAGLTGSGKTTSLRALLDYYVSKLNKRMLVAEDTRELFPQNKHTLELVTVANDDKKVAVDLRDLIMAALRLKPKYIVVGEIRGVGADAAIESMSTGHSTLFTMHAGKAEDAIDRLVDKFLTAVPNISSEVAERKVVNAVDFIAIQDDIRGIGRRVTSISEISYDSKTRSTVIKPIMKFNFLTRKFDFVNKISEAKAETMMRRGIPIEQLYDYTEWESESYRNYRKK